MAASRDEIAGAWEYATNALCPWIKHEQTQNADIGDRFQAAVDILTLNGYNSLLDGWYFEVLQQDLRGRVAPRFWQFFEAKTDCSVEPAGDGVESVVSDEDCFIKAVDYLHTVAQQYRPSICVMEDFQRDLNGKDSMLAFCRVNTVAEVVRIFFKAVVFYRTTAVFRACVDQFYAQAFKVFHVTNQDEEQECEEDSDMTRCAGCQREKEDCYCEYIMKRFHGTNAKLDEIGVLKQVSGSSVTALIHEQIQQHVEKTCKGNFEMAFLDSLENWLKTKVLVWLKLVYAGNQSNIGQEYLVNFQGRLLHFLWETYAHLQISQLFNIIIEFPESEPAVLDLKTCLQKTDLRSELVNKLKNSLETRLLHPGVNTTDILTAYISAIRALRALDPAGVILELVCDPVRKYLRSREDTVRSIVSALTDDGSNELLEELVKGQPLLDEGATREEEEGDWETWMPDPVDADPATASKSRRASDIISMLVNIYGSKELFVNEYRTLLADRILTNFNYEIEKEIRYLELLKLRFGESQLHSCEVMLKDVADSKRINTRITEERKQKGEVEEVPVSAMILSAQFWPAFREEKVKLPEHMQHLLEQYTRKFETQKGNRTLNWKSHLGLVNIEVELKDRPLNFNVSPVHAAIIMQFQDQERWTVDELSSALQVPATALRRKIAYWQSQGLLKEEQTDTFLLVEEHRGRGLSEIVIGEDEEAESAMASADAQKEEELQVFWSYIVGMLSNMDSLPLERIHSMLRMFAIQGSSGEITVEELQHFLDKKVKDQCLMYASGIYKLPKPS